MAQAIVVIMDRNSIVKTLLLSVLPAFIGVWCVSCGRTSVDTYADSCVLADTLTHHARLLTISERPDGVVLIDIADPWRRESCMGRYALVDTGLTIHDSIPAGFFEILTPVENMAVFSSVHTSALGELGALGVVKAVADAQYFAQDDSIHVLIAEAKVTDVGKPTSPSAELLVASGADIVLNSPMQGATLNLPAGIVQIPMADYMETSPIARAEWLLLLGELTCRRTEARQILDDVIDNYSDLVFRAAGASSPQPKVLTDTEYSGVWYVPAGDSYMARMIADAGGVLPWADMRGEGSVGLSLESVAERALDADVWLVRSFGYETTPESLAAMNPRYKSFKPWKDGAIYSCNTAERNVFDATAFHPDKVLREYVAIFHPEVLPDYELKYFRRMGVTK